MDRIPVYRGSFSSLETLITRLAAASRSFFFYFQVDALPCCDTGLPLPRQLALRAYFYIYILISSCADPPLFFSQKCFIICVHHNPYSRYGLVIIYNKLKFSSWKNNIKNVSNAYVISIVALIKVHQSFMHYIFSLE